MFFVLLRNSGQYLPMVFSNQFCGLLRYFSMYEGTVVVVVEFDAVKAAVEQLLWFTSRWTGAEEGVTRPDERASPARDVVPGKRR